MRNRGGAEHSYPIAGKATHQVTNISFDFKFYGFKNTYENVFQTADGNNGIRMEFGKGGLGGGWGLVMPGADGQLDFISQQTVPSRGVWHHVDIRREDADIELYLDGAFVGKTVLKNQNIAMDNIAVGTGFSKTRPFNGEVKNFRLTTSLHPHRVPTLLLIGGQVLLLLLALVIGWRVPDALQRSLAYVKGHRKECAASLVGALLLLFAIFRSTRPFIWQEKHIVFLVYEYIVLVFVPLLYGVWHRAGLRRFGAVTAVVALVVFCKSFMVHLSVVGALSDVLIGCSFLAAVQYIGGMLPVVAARVFRAAAVVLGTVVVMAVGFGAMYAHHVLHFGNGSGLLFGEEIQAVLQTNAREAFEFVVSVFSAPQIAALVLGGAAGAAMLFFASAAAKCAGRRALCHAGVIALGAVAFTVPAGTGQSLASPLAQTYDMYRTTMQQLAEYQEHRKQHAPIKATKSGKGETYVVVIGEASNRRHYGAYGYFRDTSPWLSSLRGDDHTVFFENAYASYCHTVPSLLKALTHANQYNEEVDYAAPSLIEMAKAAGFRTYWISNQNSYGLGDNPLTTIAKEADDCYFLPGAAQTLDGQIAGVLDEHLAAMDPDQNNIIFVHLIGSHAKYTARIPEGYEHLFDDVSGMEYIGDNAKDAKFVHEVLNPYDASIRYTDENLQAIYETIAARVPDVSAFIYMPDHGEDVYAQKFHNASEFTFDMARIPLVAKFSDAWIARNGGRFAAMQRNRERPFTGDLLFDFVTGVAGIDSDLYARDMDIGTDSYALTWDNAKTLWTDDTLPMQFYAKTRAVPLADDPLYIERENIRWLRENYGDKYLAIACDSIGAARDSLDIAGWPGLEVNITPNENGIKIGHGLGLGAGTATGGNIELNIELKDYLSHIPMEKVSKIWLDTKMKEPSYVKPSLDYMEQVDETYDVKRRAVMECFLMDDGMRAYAEHGWQSTFYFLADYFQSDYPCPPSVKALVANKTGKPRAYDPPAEEREAIDAYAANLADVINRQASRNVSFWAEGYPFLVQEVLPRLDHPVGLCTWAIPGMPDITDRDFVKKFKELEQTNPLLRDPRVHTVLLGTWNPYHINV